MSYAPRPPLESAMSGSGEGGGYHGASAEVGRDHEEEETVESLSNKLAIERRVQYGAEKMLDVIEQRGTGGSDDQEQIKARITAQLEQANEQIKMLESRLDRLRGGTPHRKRRPQPRLNGYASTSSLRGALSSSYTSSHLSGGSRPRLGRAGSSTVSVTERYTESTSGSTHGHRSGHGHGPAHDQGRSQYGLDTPSRNGQAGAKSPSIWSSGSVGAHRASSTSGSDALLPETDSRWRSRAGSGAITGDVTPVDMEGLGPMLETVGVAIRRLRELGRLEGRSKGKGKEVEERRDRNDEVWECMTRLADVLKRSQGLKEVISADEIIQAVLPFLSDSSTPRRRAAGYRVLRSALTRYNWGRMLSAGVEWLVIRTFTRDSKAVVEREQALLLIRGVTTLPMGRMRRHGSFVSRDPRDSPSRSRQGLLMVDADAGPDAVQAILEKRVPLTDGLVRAVVSAAENADDAMRIVCMETLVEIAILDVERVAQSDALRTVLLSFKDGPAELGPAITGMLMYLANMPGTRGFLLPGSDVEMILVGLTEEYGSVSARQAAAFTDKLQGCVRNVGMLLGSWSGLLYLCMHDKRAIRSLVSSLFVPVTEMRLALLDLIVSALHIKTPSFTEAFLEGKRLTVYQRTQEAASQSLQDGADQDAAPNRLTLVDGYLALLLAVLLECGLIEALVTLIAESVPSLSRKATLLLGEVLRMSNRVLPLRYAAQLQSLPRLFVGATAFSNAGDRHFALSALTSIDSLTRNLARMSQRTRNTAAASGLASRIRAPSLTTAGSHGPGAEGGERTLRGMQGVKLRMGLSVAVEDRLFQQMIVDSGILLGREHTKWNYDIILDLIEGPLLNAKRMDEAIRATKFMRRLLSFFQPQTNRFSSIKRTRPNQKWIRLGCALVSTMLATPEGVKYLMEDALFKQLGECFAELESTPFRQTLVLAADRVENSLTYGYFEMVGVMTREEEGMALLEKFKLFNSFYRLSELGQRDDIVRLLIECFDYTLDAHPRILLSKALTSSSMATRLFATHHLGRLVRDHPALHAWSLQLLTTQLYDTAMEVCDVAVMYLEDVCAGGAGSAGLDMVVGFRPSLEHLGEVGYPLFMRFVSTSTGFRYLSEGGYIDREMENWVTERNLLYVIEVETFIDKSLRPLTSDTTEDTWELDGLAPTHFLGELTKTPEGCMYLRERGLVGDLAEVVRLHGMEPEDQKVMTTVKSVLWALGHIGSTQGGLPFLEDEEIIEVIVEMAEQSPVLTMKGTCFFVLGLISSTVMGAETLEEMGWIATRTPLGTTTGICLPMEISRFAFIEPWTRPDVLPDPIPLPKLAGTEAEIMTYIMNLSNYVLAAKAMNNLKRIRARSPRYFSSVALFYRALRLISSNHFQAPVRRFIMDMFDIPLSPETLARLRRVEAGRTNSRSGSLPPSRAGGTPGGGAHTHGAASPVRPSMPGGILGSRSSNGNGSGLTPVRARTRANSAVAPGSTERGGVAIGKGDRPQLGRLDTDLGRFTRHPSPSTPALISSSTTNASGASGSSAAVDGPTRSPVVSRRDGLRGGTGPTPNARSLEEVEDAGSPRKSTDSASRGSIDPAEYRRRSASSPGPPMALSSRWGRGDGDGVNE